MLGNTPQNSKRRAEDKSSHKSYSHIRVNSGMSENHKTNDPGTPATDQDNEFDDLPLDSKAVDCPKTDSRHEQVEVEVPKDDENYDFPQPIFNPSRAREGYENILDRDVKSFYFFCVIISILNLAGVPVIIAVAVRLGGYPLLYAIAVSGLPQIASNVIGVLSVIRKSVVLKKYFGVMQTFMGLINFLSFMYLLISFGPVCIVFFLLILMQAITVNRNVLIFATRQKIANIREHRGTEENSPETPMSDFNAKNGPISP